jgi:hypothetical protein
MKPGYKTTEFWLTLAAMVIGVIVYALTQNDPDNAWIGRLTMIAGFLPTPAYALGRSGEKKAALTAGAEVRKAELAAEKKPTAE